MSTSATSGGSGGAAVGCIVALIGVAIAVWPAISCPPTNGAQCGANAFVMLATMPIGGVIAIVGLIVAGMSGMGSNDAEQIDEDKATETERHVPPSERPDFPNYKETEE